MSDAATDLMKIAASGPRERLPKEEQIRCSMYANLKPHCALLQAEAGYCDADDGDKCECDLCALLADGTRCWIEIKRAWEGSGYVNKPHELQTSWQTDVGKLDRLSNEVFRALVLFAFTDASPTSTETPLAKVVTSLHPRNLAITLEPRSFRWRGSFNYMTAWAWMWPTSPAVDAPRAAAPTTNAPKVDIAPAPMLWTTRETAKQLGVSERTLFRLSKEENLKRIQIGSAVRYDPADVRAWLASDRRKEAQ
jgi:excisionase family DNA binding protein